VQPREHRSALDFDGLDDEDHCQRGKHQSEDEIAQQQSRFSPKVAARDPLRPLHLNILIVFGTDAAEQRRSPLLSSKHRQEAFDDR
jgi:hypothetical protein